MHRIRKRECVVGIYIEAKFLYLNKYILKIVISVSPLEFATFYHSPSAVDAREAQLFLYYVPYMRPYVPHGTKKIGDVPYVVGMNTWNIQHHT